VSFKLHERSKVSLTICDASGSVIHKVINSRSMGYGKYVEKVNLGDLNIPDGVYFLKLEINHRVKVTRMIVVGE
ncbi:MAG: T9SS type A sorting domain-containing protein, partial [Saprospiraceae bacterium]